MSTQPEPVQHEVQSPGPVPISTNGQRHARKRKGKPKPSVQAKSKPSRTLPTIRLTVAKQLDILRAYAAASAKGTRAATINEAAEIVRMAPTTVSMANAFFASIGLLKRSDKGAYIPCVEVVQFLAQYEWDRKTAGYKLAPKLRESWFAEALLPRISFEPIDEKDAVNLLAEAANAGPEYEKELRIIIDFLVAGGILQKDGTQVKKLGKSVSPDSPVTLPGAEGDKSTDAGGRAVQVSTSYSAQSPAGGVDFNITVHVDMKEFGTWQPDRISSFFGGIAQVLAAKANVEKGGVP